MSQRRQPIHDDHRLLPRYTVQAPTASESSTTSNSARAYSTGSHVADASDALAMRGIPAIVQDGMGGTMLGTQPEDALIRKAENEGWT